ncbi:asparagine synthase (glutamine-hydrolyzing), partial [Sulfurovum sp. bin170]|uniref:asparagine synthase (glutamine-hydrolyzing) n=1 Tax=Sulfurovum sp. bin170 TaxID=2695268 RepID=UPI0013DF59AF
FNGEIYNYESLRYKDTKYQYKSDTEVLLKGFAKEGVDFLHKTRSMFGFAFYMKEDKTISICRDRIGIKQIYYIDTDEIFAFASTLKPLVMFSEKKLNSKQLWGYYLNRAFKAPHTIFEDIKEIESGSILTFNTDKKKIKSIDKWWERDSLSNILTNEQNVLEELDRLLHQSVQDRLIADVSVGAFLSGGVDSSTITAIASQYNPKLETFTVAMKDKRYDESPYAKAVSDRYNLKYHQVMIEGKEFLDEIDNWVSMQDDIVANPSSLLLYKLATLAKENGYKVMLAGEGADEIFAGYKSYKRFLISHQIYSYTKFLKPFSSPISNLFKSNSKKKFIIENILTNPAHYSESIMFEPHLVKELLNQEVEKREMYSIKEALDMDIKDRVPNDLLTSNGDRATMGASIETRVPFLSHEIVNFSAKIDDSLFVKGGETKYLLKKLATRYIPHDNIYRKKVGFEMPLKDWLRDELRDTLYQLIETSVQRDFIDMNIIKSIFKAHQEKQVDASGKLWTFMALELSYRHLISQS